MAKRLAGRFGYPESPHEFDVTFHPDRLEEPLRWPKKDMVIFTCSMSDLFHEDVPFDTITSILGIMWSSCGPWWTRTYLMLTKRPQRAAEYFASIGHTPLWPMSNAYLGVTVETQDQMWRVEELMKIPGKHFVSLEPLLGPVEMPRQYLGYCPECGSHYRNLEKGDWRGCWTKDGKAEWLQHRCSDVHAQVGHWDMPLPLSGVIVGGESGPGARPCDVDWIRAIVQQGKDAGIPVTVKQLGTVWASSVKSRTAKGNDPAEWATDLRIRQFPEAIFPLE